MLAFRRLSMPRQATEVALSTDLASKDADLASTDGSTDEAPDEALFDGVVGMEKLADVRGCEGSSEASSVTSKTVPAPNPVAMSAAHCSLSSSRSSTIRYP